MTAPEVVKRKGVLRKPPEAQQERKRSSFLNCFVGETQTTKKSALQTNLLGNNCFCLKQNCSGIVHVVEMERTRTLACSDIPLYNIETRRLVKCNKCFYVSSLQAHRMNSSGAGNAKLANRMLKKNDGTEDSPTRGDTNTISQNTNGITAKSQNIYSGIVTKNVFYQAKIKKKKMEQSPEEVGSKASTSHLDDKFTKILNGIRRKELEEYGNNADNTTLSSNDEHGEIPSYGDRDELYPEVVPEKEYPSWALYVDKNKTKGQNGQRNCIQPTASDTKSDIVHYLRRATNKAKTDEKAGHSHHNDDGTWQKAENGTENGSSWSTSRDRASTSRQGPADPPMDDPQPVKERRPADPKGRRLREPRGRKKSVPSLSSKLLNPARMHKYKSVEQGKGGGRSDPAEHQYHKPQAVKDFRKTYDGTSEGPVTPDMEAWRRNHEVDFTTTPETDARRLLTREDGRSPDWSKLKKSREFGKFEELPQTWSERQEDFRFSRLSAPSTPIRQQRDEVQEFRSSTPPGRDQQKQRYSKKSEKSPPFPDDSRKLHRHGRGNLGVPPSITVRTDSPVVSLSTIRADLTNEDADPYQIPTKWNTTIVDENDLDGILQDSITYLKQRYPNGATAKVYADEAKMHFGEQPRKSEEETTVKIVNNTMPRPKIFPDLLINDDDTDTHPDGTSWVDL